MIKKNTTRKAVAEPALKVTDFDAAVYLTGDENLQVEYLNQAFASGELDLINDALGNIAKARGMAKVAEKTGVNRQNLYKALGKGGNPTLDTLVKVISALDMKLSVAAA